MSDCAYKWVCECSCSRTCAPDECDSMDPDTMCCQECIEGDGCGFDHDENCPTCTSLVTHG